MVLTVAFALLVCLILVVWVDVLGLSDPVQVTLQILLQLLLLTQLLKVSTGFSLLSFLGELSEFAEAQVHRTHKTDANTQECMNYKIYTYSLTLFHNKERKIATHKASLIEQSFFSLQQLTTLYKHILLSPKMLR